MDATIFTTMLTDRSMTDLKKMQHKYSPEQVAEFISIVKTFFYKKIPLPDFNQNPLVYLESHTQISLNTPKTLLAKRPEGEPYSYQAMADEIQSSLMIENIQTSRESIRHILNGYAPQNKTDSQLFGMKKGMDFISDPTNRISEVSIHQLYQMVIGNYLEDEDKLLPGSYYRHDAVYLVGDKIEHQGLSADQLPNYMKELVKFISSDPMNDLLKAIVIHFYLAYLHPYFDGNGRMARLMQLWYLVTCGYGATMFIPFSNHIEASKNKYYRAFSLVEANAKISGVLDMTPFFAYFIENVYAHLSSDKPMQERYLETYEKLLSEGRITEKENDLFRFVLTAYGQDEFSTKQLEKDFRKAAYATIRSFVLKFSALGLLKSQKYGNRNRYRLP
ncbi:Fic family protein [Acetobacterium wieringae]|uniref:Fic family protein n=1 Tax=Acetobacterium wieringae TaxID=52694 RepID=UPI0031593155